MSGIFGGNPGYVRLKKLYNSIFPGKSSIIYLLRDEFTTPQAAPLTSPRTCAPGPGILTLDQVSGNYSIVNDALHNTASNAGGAISPRAVGSSQSRIAGRAFISKVTVAADRFIAGWSSDGSNAFTSVLHGIQITGSAFNAFFDTSGSSVVVGVEANGTPYQIALVLRGTGCFVLVNGGAFSNWTLLFVNISSSVTPMFPIVGSFFGGGVAAADVDYFHIRDLGGAFSTDYGIATLNVATAVSGANYAADADGLYDLAFTLPAGSANLVAVELKYRYQDALNFWDAYIKRNAGNTAWDFFLDSVVAGTPTNRLTATGVGTPDMIRVIADGALHDCYTKAATTWTKRGAEINNAAFQTQSTLNPVAGAGTTLGGIQGWARRSALYNVLSAT